MTNYKVGDKVKLSEHGRRLYYKPMGGNGWATTPDATYIVKRSTESTCSIELDNYGMCGVDDTWIVPADINYNP